jgi:putative holliday junction resolvase
VRVLGLDLGSRRVGVAVSDASGKIASPRAVLTRSGDADADRVAIVDVVRAEEAELVVVGLPVSLDGRERGPAAAARREAEALAELLEVPVETHDERLTSVLAARLRREQAEAVGGQRERGARARNGGSPRASGRRRVTPDRRPVDAEAAAVMLQSFLDGRGGPPPPT